MQHGKLMLALMVVYVLSCSGELVGGKRWRNGLELFHGLELCSPLELLLRSRCLTELEPELVVAALINCSAFAVDGLVPLVNVIDMFWTFVPLDGHRAFGQRTFFGRTLGEFL